MNCNREESSFWKKKNNCWIKSNVFLKFKNLIILLVLYPQHSLLIISTLSIVLNAIQKNVQMQNFPTQQLLTVVFQLRQVQRLNAHRQTHTGGFHWFVRHRYTCSYRDKETSTKNSADLRNHFSNPKHHDYHAFHLQTRDWPLHCPAPAWPAAFPVPTDRVWSSAPSTRACPAADARLQEWWITTRLNREIQVDKVELVGSIE